MSAASAPAVIVAITGASGAAYGVCALRLLRAHGYRTHLLVSAAGWLTLHQECGLHKAEVHALADVVHSPHEVGACIASGSFRATGMLIAPCSMKTLAAVAHGFADNLISRAADVMLKERRPLVLMTREAPLNLAHLRNMTAVTEMGGIIFPPVPAFYQHPESLEALVQDTTVRALAALGIDVPEQKVWAGLAAN